MFFIISFFYSLQLINAVITGYLFGFIFSFYFGREWILSPRYKFKITTFFKFVSTYALGFLSTLIITFIASYNFQFGNILSWFIGTTITALLNLFYLNYGYSKIEKIADQRWGGLSKLVFLQVLASNVIAYINPAITHNLEKNIMLLKKSFIYLPLKILVVTI